MSNIHADISRLWLTLMRSAEIGATPKGGLRRLALSEEDGAMRRQFVEWCVGAGCEVRVDAVGNIFARRAGTDPQAKSVLVGSHLDTQIKGGRFDGILGVLAGLELVRTLNDHSIETRRPITIVNWTNEEGARFEPPMVGSAVFTGQFTPDFAYSRKDADAVMFGEALEAIGFRGTNVVAADEFDSLFELHIEQGPKLDASRTQLGIVTGAFGVRGMVVKVEGETGHVGPTPMEVRRNALVGAAEVTLAVEAIGWDRREEDAKSTTMRIKVEPNVLGALPDLVEMTCDFRHPEDDAVTEMLSSFKAAIPDMEKRSRCRIAVKQEWSYGGIKFDADLAAMARETAERLGYSHTDMPTEAGHDAMHVARTMPTVMIFTPCDKGLSHNEAENVTISGIEPGMNVLLGMVLTRTEMVEVVKESHPRQQH